MVNKLMHPWQFVSTPSAFPNPATVAKRLRILWPIFDMSHICDFDRQLPRPQVKIAIVVAGTVGDIWKMASNRRIKSPTVYCRLKGRLLSKMVLRPSSPCIYYSSLTHKRFNLLAVPLLFFWFVTNFHLPSSPRSSLTHQRFQFIKEDCRWRMKTSKFK